MTFEALLAEFRALGGVAENIRLDEGPYGRGIFVVDPSRPAALHCPVTLQVPMNHVSVDGDQMCADAGVNAPARGFFDTYQQQFGWGPGTHEHLRAEQTAWHDLPASLREKIAMLGAGSVTDMRFRAPDLAVCVHNYLHARKFLRDGGAYIVPLVDLVNHSGYMPEYVYADGIGVRGTFADEMLVRYNSADPWGIMLLYGFAAPAPTAFSLAVTLALPDGRSVSIARDISDFRERAGLRFPALAVRDNELAISHLALGFQPAKDLPRAIFRSLVGAEIAPPQADAIFDSIQHYNRTQFIELLRLLRKYDGPLMHMLEEAVLYQLETLSACVGARSL